MAGDRSAAEAQSEWWEQWRRADYTWDGLAKHRLFGWSVRRNGALVRSQDATKTAKPATLQDLWRSEANRLVIDADGDTWTVVHAPLVSRGGDPLKSAWTQAQLDRIDTAVRDAEARLPSGLAASFTADVSASRTRWPLVLDGAVLAGRLPALRGLPILQARWIAFGDVEAVPWSMLLRQALFTRPLSIVGEAFNARIIRAIFIRGIALLDVSIERFILSSSQVFAAFTADELAVAGEFRVSTSFIADDFKASSITGGQLALAHVRVAGSVDLDGIDGSGLRLQSSRLEGDLEIKDSTVSRVTARDLRVDGDVTLNQVVSNGAFDLARARISGRFETTGLKARRGDFSDASFTETAAFREAEFKETVGFERAHFAKSAYFNDARFSPDRKHVGSAFRGARFDDFLDFSGVGPLNFAAFDGARFKAEVRFDSAIFEKDAAFEKALAGATNDDLRSLEHGLRSLKQAAETIRDRTAEQTFFRYELIARRRRAGPRREEFWLSWLYGAVSNYGSSFWRPLVTALLLVAVFAAAYIGLGAAFGVSSVEGMRLTGGSLHPAVTEAFSLSARSTFNLFGVWTLRPIQGATGLESQLLHGTPWHGFWTRVLSSVQSVFAGILLFLVALAARRRFQIN